MLRILVPVVAAALLLGDGLLFGRWTNRWEPSQRMAAAVASLEKVPLKLGEGANQWEGESLPAYDEKILKQAGFAGYLHRRYENRDTGVAVNMLLACGPCGPLSVHTPEFCYAGAGFSQQGSKTPHTEEFEPSTGAAQLWKAKFSKAEAAIPVHLRVYWTWNGGHGWQAPDNPRWIFAGRDVLYKLYVVSEIGRESDSKQADSNQKFLRVLLPELEKHLDLNR